MRDIGLMEVIIFACGIMIATALFIIASVSHLPGIQKLSSGGNSTYHHVV